VAEIVDRMGVHGSAPKMRRPDTSMTREAARPMKLLAAR
jgi:hypothetical protein